ncbi:MAG: hydrogenase maturation protease [Candidatus Marinimicrobia bacterium]|nr:hydrogenase maturation protease [Candidatus Neomarinimicrobiota bacterium]
MMNNLPKILFYGYGNPGRQDDGVGIAFTEQLNDWVKMKDWHNINFDSNYQLNIEDADNISSFDLVIFADATQEKSISDFDIDLVKPNSEVNFTMHAVSPGFILNLCSEIKKQPPITYLLQIKGYKWEFQKELSEKAKINVQKAFKFIQTNLLNFYNNKYNTKDLSNIFKY